MNKKLVKKPFLIGLGSSLLISATFPLTFEAKTESDIWPRDISQSPAIFTQNPETGNLEFSTSNPTYLYVPEKFTNGHPISFYNFYTPVNGTFSRNTKEISFIDTKYLSGIKASLFYNGQLEKIYWNSDEFYESDKIILNEFAFRGNKIKELNLPSKIVLTSGVFYQNQISKIIGLKDLKSIGVNTFSENKLISYDSQDGYRFQLPTSDTYTSVDRQAFYKNELTDLFIPKNITLLGSNAFYQNPITRVFIENNNFSGIDTYGLPSNSGLIVYSAGFSSRIKSIAQSFYGSYVNLAAIGEFLNNTFVVGSEEYTNALNAALAELETVDSELIKLELEDRILGRVHVNRSSNLITNIQNAIDSNDISSLQSLIDEAENQAITIPSDVLGTARTLINNSIKDNINNAINTLPTNTAIDAVDFRDIINNINSIDDEATKNTLLSDIENVITNNISNGFTNALLTGKNSNNLEALLNYYHSLNDLPLDDSAINRISSALDTTIVGNYSDFEDLLTTSKDLANAIALHKLTDDLLLSSKLKASIDNFYNDLNQKQTAQINGKITDINNLENELHSLKTSKNSLSDKNLALENEIGSLKKEIQALLDSRKTSDKASNKDGLNNLVSNINEAASNSNTSSSITQALEGNKSIKDIISLPVDSPDTLDTTVISDSFNLSDSEDEFPTDIKSVKSELVETKQKVVTLEKEVSEAKNENTILKQENIILKNENVSLNHSNKETKFYQVSFFVFVLISIGATFLANRYHRKYKKAVNHPETN